MKVHIKTNYQNETKIYENRNSPSVEIVTSTVVELGNILVSVQFVFHLLQFFINVFFKFIKCKRSIPFDDISLTIDEKLCVVRLDSIDQPTSLLRFHKSVEGVCACAVDCYLIVDVEQLPLVLIVPLLDFFVGFVFLEELIRREDKHLELIVIIALFHRAEMCIVRGSHGSAGCTINYHNNLPLVLRHLRVLSIDVRCKEIVKGGRRLRVLWVLLQKLCLFQVFVCTCAGPEKASDRCIEETKH